MSCRPRVSAVSESGTNPRGIPNPAAASARHKQPRARTHRAAHHGGVERLSLRHSRGGRMRRAVVAVTFFALLLGLWQLATMSGRWSPVILPPPTMVAE